MSRIVLNPQSQVTGYHYVSRCDDDLNTCVRVGKIVPQGFESWAISIEPGFVRLDCYQSQDCFFNFDEAVDAFSNVFSESDVERISLHSGEMMLLHDGILYPTGEFLKEFRELSYEKEMEKEEKEEEMRYEEITRIKYMEYGTIWDEEAFDNWDDEIAYTIEIYDSGEERFVLDPDY